MYKIIGADGKEYGPIPLDQFRQWIAENRVNGQTQVKAEGGTEWKDLSTFPELAALLAVRPAGAGLPPLSGGARPMSAAPGSIPNYLVQSILVTLCCCLPFGVVAIVYAAQVDSKLRMGDVAGAQAASNSAKMWGWIAFGLGVLSNGVVILLYALGAMAGARQF